MEIEQVPAHEWEEWIEKNDGVLLDIREPVEWELGTLPGAIRLRMGELPDSLESLDPGRPTLVVCRSGNRSQQVAAYLTMCGFDNAANMAGGMHALGMQE
ncbi:MAG: rhodanese-like domain-containing protein [Actinomycetota bacterium]